MNAFRQILVNFLLFLALKLELYDSIMLRFGPFKWGNESKASCHNYSLIQGRCEVSEVFVRLFFEQKVNESDSPWGHLQQQKYQASWNTESVASPMNKTVGSVVNSDSHLDAPLTRLNVQEEV